MVKQLIFLIIIISFILMLYTPVSIIQWLLLSLFTGLFYFYAKRPIQTCNYPKLLTFVLVFSCFFNIYLGVELFQSEKAGKNGLICHANSIQLKLQEINKMLLEPNWDSIDNLYKLQTDLIQTVYFAKAANQFSYVNSINHSRLSTEIGELGYLLNTKYVNAADCLSAPQKTYCVRTREEYKEELKMLKNKLEETDFDNVSKIKDKENEQEIKKLQSKILIFLEN